MVKWLSDEFQYALPLLFNILVHKLPGNLTFASVGQLKPTKAAGAPFLALTSLVCQATSGQRALEVENSTKQSLEVPTGHALPAHIVQLTLTPVCSVQVVNYFTPFPRSPSISTPQIDVWAGVKNKENREGCAVLEQTLKNGLLCKPGSWAYLWGVSEKPQPARN